MGLHYQDVPLRKRQRRFRATERHQLERPGLAMGYVQEGVQGWHALRPRCLSLQLLGCCRPWQLLLNRQDRVRLLTPRALLDALIEALHQQLGYASQQDIALGIALIAGVGDAGYRPAFPPEELELVAQVDVMVQHDAVGRSVGRAGR